VFITYMIGNGFDVGVGLDTRYSDFLKYYLGKVSPDAKIQRGKNIIKKQMSINTDTWADMEVALGTLPTLFNAPNVHVTFRLLYEDIVNELSCYLLAQEQKINFNRFVDLIANDFTSAIIRPYTFLQKEHARGDARPWQQLMEKTVDFAFLSFNYTRVFDQCIDILKRNEARRDNSQAVYTKNLNPVVHIHGTLNNKMILGVDGESQIVDADTVQKDDKTMLIKPQINLELRKKSVTIAESYISSSQIIVIYGMSLGPTDKKWWSLLCDWLHANETRHLIVYVWKKNYIPAIPGHTLATIQDIRKLFCSYSTYGELSDSVFNRIHVLINEPLFTLKLSG
jgi:hypothetical protein